MARGTTGRSAGNQEKLRSHWSEIQAWRTEGMSKREMARRLHMSESSFRDALAQVDNSISTKTATIEPQVHEGIPMSKTEEARAVLTELHALLPTLQTIAHEWPSLREMLSDWSQRQRLLHVSPTYQPYDGFYSCRLNNRLIQAIKEFAAKNRLSQSELMTMALQAYMERHGGVASNPVI
jgi:hypothetical protein